VKSLLVFTDLRFIIGLISTSIFIFTLLAVGSSFQTGSIEAVSFSSIRDQEGNVTDPEGGAGMNTSIDYIKPTLRDPGLKVELVYGGKIKFPTTMAFLGPNDILVLEKNSGKVKRIINGTLQSEPLLDAAVNHVGGRGMLGIAVANDGIGGPTYVFLYFTLSSTKDDSYNLTEESGNHLYRFEFKDNSLIHEKLLLNVTALSPKKDGGHNGGKLILGPDQNLYLIVGDLREHRTKAQNNSTGPQPDGTSVIYRISQDGKPAVDNPFGKNNEVNKFYAYGIRNSFGLDFDPLTGNLWETENGPDYGDEINLVKPGFNSGWKRQMGFLVNPLYPDEFVDIGEQGKSGKYSDPEFVWKTPVAPSALKFLNSEKLGNQYKNDMFVADTNLGNIYHFDLRDNRTNLAIYTPLRDKVADSLEELERITFGQGFGRITDFQVGPDGYLYILTHNWNFDGAIFRIVPANLASNTQ